MFRVNEPVLSIVTPNTTAPVSLEDVRLHVKAVSDVEDSLLEASVLAAAAYWEEQTGRPIMRTVFDWWLDGFPSTYGTLWPSRLFLPRPPLVSVDALTYTDGDGNELGFTDGASPETAYWRAVAPAGLYAPVGWVEPISGQSWPTPAFVSDAVKIRFTAGYAATAAQVPPIIRAQILLLVGAMEQFRSEVHYSEGAKAERVPTSIVDLTAFKYNAPPPFRRAW